MAVLDVPVRLFHRDGRSWVLGIADAAIAAELPDDTVRELAVEEHPEAATLADAEIAVELAPLLEAAFLLKHGDAQ